MHRPARKTGELDPSNSPNRRVGANKSSNSPNGRVGVAGWDSDYTDGLTEVQELGLDRTNGWPRERLDGRDGEGEGRSGS
ncbi:hypothetical protein F2Q70_00016749 [Brassica cretica]|uniref:Uncharacterized protein n=1 Tax=Brassica cretica TaxID=69181 RepID=A0A8S9KVL6_BRACR|nr:hypothetical protein F2Q70_00016749 [Brassica cretica]KAF2599144.1 hypothetical protein F2Q68_00009726 [Brassica cretica]